MRFADGGAPEDVEAHLGELACALEARARGAPGETGQARLVFAAGVLGASERAFLLEAGTAAEAPTAGGLASLTIEPERLAELARRSPAAHCLLAAHRAATRPRGPARVMGILNVTPDSFSDGGTHLGVAGAVEHGRRLFAEGADIVDVGGESTRPGAEPVPSAVERERVVPVVAALAGQGPLSVDTTKAEVARAALEAGATIVNDVSAGSRDPELLPVVAKARAGLVLMHLRGQPRDMQRDPRYDDVVREVAAHLRARARAAWRAGVDPARIALDPGIGFGKLLEHNLRLMRALPELRSLGFPLCLGVSRKSFLGRLSGEEQAARRGPETLAAVVLADGLGAEIHRVHEVAPVRAALRVARALAADKGP